MPLPEAPNLSKAEVPQSTFGKILTATPVVMTVVATLLAGLASSEMTSAQYDRSLAAQQQSKAGDQWSYFQAKKLRGALHQSALDVVQATAEVHPLDIPALKSILEQRLPAKAGSGADLDAFLKSNAGQSALSAFAQSEALKVPTDLPLDPKLQGVIDAIVGGRPDSETASLIAQLSAKSVDTALHAAQTRAEAFADAIKPLNQNLDAIAKLLSATSAPESSRSASRDFTAARLGYDARRYDAEARLNQSIGNLYEVQVHLSNFAAERHRLRSQRFFFGMLIAQAAVIISTLAMAARQRNVLWSLAAVAGLVAVAFAFYVYLFV